MCVVQVSDTLASETRESLRLAAAVEQGKIARQGAASQSGALCAALAFSRSPTCVVLSRCDVGIVSALSKMKAAGKLPGLVGRLGDLGSIDDAYDVAISTAAGGHLDSIVCKDKQVCVCVCVST